MAHVDSCGRLVTLPISITGMDCNCFSDECFHGDEDYEYGRCDVCESPMNRDLVCESCCDGMDALGIAGVAEVERMIRR